MKTIVSFLLIVLMFGNTLILSQTKTIPIKKFEKATLKNGNLKKLIISKLKYPSREAIENNSQGTVVLSVVINKEGKMKEMTILKSPDIILSRISILALNMLKLNFKPTKINDKIVGQIYQLVINYKLLLNTSLPTNYKKVIKKDIKKNKFEKALKYLNKAIAINPYDFELYKYKSIVENKLGNVKGAKEEYINSVYIHRKILTFVNIYGMGISRKSVEKIYSQKTIIRN